MLQNQAKALVKEKEIVVIPTKTVPQGITAIISFMPDADAKANEDKCWRNPAGEDRTGDYERIYGTF